MAAGLNGCWAQGSELGQRHLSWAVTAKVQGNGGIFGRAAAPPGSCLCSGRKRDRELFFPSQLRIISSPHPPTPPLRICAGFQRTSPSLVLQRAGVDTALDTQRRSCVGTWWSRRHWDTQGRTRAPDARDRGFGYSCPPARAEGPLRRVSESTAEFPAAAALRPGAREPKAWIIRANYTCANSRSEGLGSAAGRATSPGLSPAIPPQQKGLARGARAEPAEGRTGGEPGPGSPLSPLPYAGREHTHTGGRGPGSPRPEGHRGLEARTRTGSQLPLALAEPSRAWWVGAFGPLGFSYRRGLLQSIPLCGRSEAAVDTLSPEHSAPRECLLDEKGTESGAGVGRPYPDEPHHLRKTDFPEPSFARPRNGNAATGPL